MHPWVYLCQESHWRRKATGGFLRELLICFLHLGKHGSIWIFFFCFETKSHVILLASNLLCNWGWPWASELNAGIWTHSNRGIRLWEENVEGLTGLSGSLDKWNKEAFLSYVGSSLTKRRAPDFSRCRLAYEGTGMGVFIAVKEAPEWSAHRWKAQEGGMLATEEQMPFLRNGNAGEGPLAIPGWSPRCLWRCQWEQMGTVSLQMGGPAKDTTSFMYVVFQLESQHKETSDKPIWRTFYVFFF